MPNKKSKKYDVAILICYAYWTECVMDSNTLI